MCVRLCACVYVYVCPSVCMCVHVCVSVCVLIQYFSGSSSSCGLESMSRILFHSIVVAFVNTAQTQPASICPASTADATNSVCVCVCALFSRMGVPYCSSIKRRLVVPIALHVVCTCALFSQHCGVFPTAPVYILVSIRIHVVNEWGRLS